MPHALHILVFTVAGCLDRHHEDLIDYLREENRVLRWYRHLIAQKHGGSVRRRRGRPVTPTGSCAGILARCCVVWLSTAKVRWKRAI